MAEPAGDADDEINIDEFSQSTPYIPPVQRSVQEILDFDNNDESLKRYKEKLLEGAFQNEIIVVDKGNPSTVIMKRLSVVENGVVRRSLELPVSQEIALSIKEGCHYKIQLEFYVQREIVTGLKYLHKVTRLGLGVTKESYMLGSYGPRKELYVYTSPVEEAPSGLLSRGKYRVRSLITDDDKNRWLEWIWHIEVTKEW